MGWLETRLSTRSRVAGHLWCHSLGRGVKVVEPRGVRRLHVHPPREKLETCDGGCYLALAHLDLLCVQPPWVRAKVPSVERGVLCGQKQETVCGGGGRV
jgi:hypothetical protein